jgi:predicted nucleic acid-binding protein
MILLDSSAWLAHLFGEPGAEQVTLLFDNAADEVSISALSITEVYGRLKALDAQDHWQEVWNLYSLLFSNILAADEAIAHLAVSFRAAASRRLPTIDGLIAATAAHHEMTLVHRDPHFAAIPSDLLQQIQLADK